MQKILKMLKILLTNAYIFIIINMRNYAIVWL